jgi:hypothetical protein
MAALIFQNKTIAQRRECKLSMRRWGENYLIITHGFTSPNSPRHSLQREDLRIDDSVAFKGEETESKLKAK